MWKDSLTPPRGPGAVWREHHTHLMAPPPPAWTVHPDVLPSQLTQGGTKSFPLGSGPGTLGFSFLLGLEDGRDQPTFIHLPDLRGRSGGILGNSGRKADSNTGRDPGSHPLRSLVSWCFGLTLRILPPPAHPLSHHVSLFYPKA